MDNNNVLEFPKKIDKENFPLSIEHSYEHIENVRRDYCDEVCSDVMEAAFSVLSSYGITVKPDEQNVKYIVFLEEAIKSMVYSTKRLSHNFQDLADTLITLTPQAHAEIDGLIEEKQLNT
jgi:hypothetical protein